MPGCPLTDRGAVVVCVAAMSTARFSLLAALALTAAAAGCSSDPARDDTSPPANDPTPGDTTSPNPTGTVLDGATRMDGGADGDAGSPTDAAVDGEADAPAPTPPAPTFAQVYAILEPSCAGCHGENGLARLDLSTPAAAYTGLVSAKARGNACNDGVRVLVVPGSAETSLLYQKMAGTQTCGRPMPPNGALVPAADLAIVGAWINDGAKGP